MNPSDAHGIANTKQTATAFTLALSPGVPMVSSGGRPMLVRWTEPHWRVFLPGGLTSRHDPQPVAEPPPLIPPASMPHESVMQAMITGGYRGV